MPRRTKPVPRNTLSKCREEMGLTQAQLADKIGVKTQTVSDWERGEYEVKMTPQQMLRCTEALGVSLERFCLYFEEEIP